MAKFKYFWKVAQAVSGCFMTGVVEVLVVVAVLFSSGICAGAVALWAFIPKIKAETTNTTPVVINILFFIKPIISKAKPLNR